MRRNRHPTPRDILEELRVGAFGPPALFVSRMWLQWDRQRAAVYPQPEDGVFPIALFSRVYLHLASVSGSFSSCVVRGVAHEAALRLARVCSGILAEDAFADAYRGALLAGREAEARLYLSRITGFDAVSASAAYQLCTYLGCFYTKDPRGAVDAESLDSNDLAVLVSLVDVVHCFCQRYHLGKMVCPDLSSGYTPVVSGVTNVCLSRDMLWGCVFSSDGVTTRDTLLLAMWWRMAIQSQVSGIRELCLFDVYHGVAYTVSVDAVSDGMIHTLDADVLLYRDGNDLADLLVCGYTPDGVCPLEDDDVPEDEHPGRERLLNGLAVGSGIVIVALSVYLIGSFFGWFVRPGRSSEILEETVVSEDTDLTDASVSVPDLKGMTESKARETLERIGLSLSVSDGDGVVVSQSVNPGILADAGDVISVTLGVLDDAEDVSEAVQEMPSSETPSVSSEERPSVSSMVSVPNVTGMSREAAESALRSAGLSVGTVSTVSHDQAAAGLVVSQGVFAGAEVSSGTPVDLTVSLGAQNASYSFFQVLGIQETVPVYIALYDANNALLGQWLWHPGDGSLTVTASGISTATGTLAYTPEGVQSGNAWKKTVSFVLE